MQTENQRPARAGQPGATGAARSVSVNEKVNEFVQKHRKPIFVFLALVALSLIGFIATLSIMDMLKGKAISAVEELGTRYGVLYPTITEDFSAVDANELLADIEAFAKKNSNYAGAKAWSIAGSINADRKDWAASEAAWVSAAKAAKGTYLVPVAYFNAAVTAEEQGKTEQAIEYYSLCLEGDDFSEGPRAQFAIGRLQEALGQNAAAVEAYRAIASRWPYAGLWSSLARSRIIVLE